MKNQGFTIAIPMLFLTACNWATHAPTPTLPALPKATATATPVPLVNLEGELFFDYNGSGLRDGDEPGIPNFKVCIKAKDICATTDDVGNYVFDDLATKGTRISLSVLDPNADDPALAMRYMNLWNKAVVIDSHEINGVQVPEQHLNDTSLLTIDKGFTATVGETNQTGLLQGFLTLPFIQSQVPEPYVENYFDILNETTACGKPVPRDGLARSYDGQYSKIGDPFVPRVGVGDSHTGIDYLVDVGTFVVSAGPQSTVWLLDKRNDGELMVFTGFPDPEGTSLMYSNTYAHLGAQLVQLNQTVYRGQIVALSGDTGANNTFGGYGTRRVPQLHFDLFIGTAAKCSHYLDPYRYTFAAQKSDDFSGSNVSYWTADNKPHHAR